MDDRPAKVVVGDRLADRYVVEALLGAGTMAYVVQAVDTRTEERVACKIPLDGSASKTKALKDQYRFLRMARTPSLQTLYNLEHHVSVGETFEFLVFEFVEGEDLEKWQRDQPLRARIEALATVAEGIALLTEAGAAHGDIYGPNVVVQSTGRIVLIDPEPETFGSSRPSSLRERSTISAANLRDRQGLLSLATELIHQDERDVAPWLFKTHDGSAPPTARDLAIAMRLTLSQPFLPGQRTLEDVADNYRKRTANERSKFLELAKGRDFAFKTASATLERIASGFGLAKKGPLATTTSDELLRIELASGSQSLSQLHNRFLCFETPNGDELRFTFNGQSSIRRPWPNPTRKGLVDVGSLSVHREGVAIAISHLELWSQDDRPHVVVREHDRYRLFDGPHLERTIRVLVEELIPGVEQPYVLNPPTRPSSIFPLDPSSVHSWFKSRGRSIADAPGRDALLNASMEMILSSDSLPHPKRMRTCFGDFFKTPVAYSARLAFVRQVAKEFLEGFGAFFTPLYRFDVQVLDEVDGNLRIVIETAPASHSFDFRARSTREMIEAQAKRRGMRTGPTLDE